MKSFIHELERENWKLREEVDCKANKLKMALAQIESLQERLNAYTDQA